MISAIIERPWLVGVPFLVSPGKELAPEVADEIRRSGRPLLHLPRRALTRSERRNVRRVRAAELEHLQHPDRWVAKRRRRYEIDRKVDLYRDVIRAIGGGFATQARIAAHSGAGPLDPMSILQADGVTVEQYCIADLDVSISTGVSGWGDQTANNFDYSQATGVNQPTHVTAAAAINNRNYVDFDGSNDSLSASGPILSQPSAADSWLWMVFLQGAWGANDRIVSDISANPPNSPIQESSSPLIKQRSSSATGVNQVSFALDTWGELVSFSNDDTTDYLKVGSTTSTGNNSSTGTEATGTGRRIASNPGNTTWTDMACAAIIYALSNPSGSAQDTLRNWITAYYGAGVLV